MPSSEDQKLAFDREKWADELKLRQRELDIKGIEAEAKSKEQDRQFEQLHFTQDEARRNRWINPLVVAVFTAALAGAGNAIVALVNGSEQRTIEQIKADQGLILESIKANNDPDKAAANLRFLVDTALIANPERRTEIISFLNRRKPGEGPALPSSNPTAQRTLDGADLLQRVKQSTGLIKVNAVGQDGSNILNIGTTFIVNDQGYALTTAHLIPEGSSHIEAQVTIGSALAPVYPAEIILNDRDLDLALIRIRGIAPAKPVRPSQGRAQIAQSVLIVGFPIASDISLLQGIVTSLDQPHGGIGLSAATPPGMSGSPVFDDTGEVVAVVAGRRADVNVTIVIPIQMASSLLQRVGISR